jgi:hypothetical protein
MAARRTALNFKTMLQADVPKGREGKHKEIVTQILSDLAQMNDGVAIKVPLKDLAERRLQFYGPQQAFNRPQSFIAQRLSPLRNFGNSFWRGNRTDVGKCKTKPHEILLSGNAILATLLQVKAPHSDTLPELAVGSC